MPVSVFRRLLDYKEIRGGAIVLLAAVTATGIITAMNIANMTAQFDDLREFPCLHKASLRPEESCETIR